MCPFKTFVFAVLALVASFAILRPTVRREERGSGVFRIVMTVLLVAVHVDVLLNLGYLAAVGSAVHTFMLVK